MGRVDFNEVDNYQNQGGSGTQFFSLTNDGDKAIVRFLVNSIADLEILAIHDLKVGDKYRKISCCRSYNEPVDACPLCRMNQKVTIKYYVPLMVYEQTSDGRYVGTVKLWERGSNFKSDISTMVSTYSPLSNYPFTIVRNGQKGNMQTKYNFLPIVDRNVVASIPPVDFESIEIPEALGTIVMNKTVDEINYFLQNSKFPDVENKQSRNTQYGQNNYQQGYQQSYPQTNNYNQVPNSYPQQNVQQYGYNQQTPPTGPIPGQNNNNFPTGRRRSNNVGNTEIDGDPF